MFDDPVGLISRFLHILAAMTAAGGAIFMRFALLPAAEHLPSDQHEQLKAALRARWSKILMACIAFLLLSGFYNFFAINAMYKEATDKTPGEYHGLFGVKFLLALAIFAISSILSGRSKGTEGIRKNAKTYLTLNVILIVALVLVSAVMRGLHTAPNELRKTVTLPTQSEPAENR